MIPEYLSIVDDDHNGYYDTPVGCRLRKEKNNTKQPLDLLDGRSASIQTVSDLTRRIDT
jgi:hypothetical protein